MLRKFVMGAWLLVVGAGVLAAQSNEKIDQLLSQAPARLDSTAYLLMAAGGLVTEEVEFQAAFDTAVASGFIAKDRQPEDGVSLEDLSFLVMKTQNFPGGVEWSLLPTPRAAYRELVYRNAVNASAGPRRLVAGDEVIRVLNQVMVLKGGEE